MQSGNTLPAVENELNRYTVPHGLAMPGGDTGIERVGTWCQGQDDIATVITGQTGYRLYIAIIVNNITAHNSTSVASAAEAYATETVPERCLVYTVATKVLVQSTILFYTAG